jgi:putative transposase
MEHGVASLAPPWGEPTRVHALVRGLRGAGAQACTSPEQIVAILRRVEQGKAAEVVCRSVNISEATLYRWKQPYEAMELDEVKQLKALREENARLKRLVADQALNIQVLKEVTSKK